ncbi:hypothetical protein [Actinoplanes sp. NPDC089786]|uniref:hypothetical protein n=1 Tax=Actinoplanes sp. NPDC089786 TaxID=3155185 RepID=UPI00343545DF
MHCIHTPYVYLCAFTHYTGGTLAFGREDLTLDRPITHEDVDQLNTQLQERGFRQAMVISFSLFGPSRN